MQLKYQADSKILKFNTRVKTVEEKKDGVYVELEESYFYPEGGGQLKDEGTINGKEVLDLMIKDGVLYHKLASFSGLTIKLGVFSSVNGLRPFRLRPARFSSTYSPTTSSILSRDRISSLASCIIILYHSLYLLAFMLK